MALNVSDFLDTLIDALENCNRAKYSNPQVVRITVCGRVQEEGDIKVTLAGEKESTIHITPDEDDLLSVAEKISGITASNYSSELEDRRVTFTAKGKKETISDNFNNYGSVTIYGNLGSTVCDSGNTGVSLVLMETPGYACDFDEYFDLKGTITIRKRLKNAMTPMYEAIFNGILDLTFPCGVIPFVNAIPSTVPTATPANPTVPIHKSSSFSAELTKVNMSREGSLSLSDKLRAETARNAFAAPFESWVLTSVYTIPVHLLDTIAPVAPVNPGTTSYSGKNASDVMIEFTPLDGTILSTSICASLGLKDGNAIEYMNLICKVLADHINNNWEIGWSSGSISYSGVSTTAAIASGVSTSSNSDINK